MTKVVTTLLKLIAPNDAGLLWQSLKESSQINERYSEPSSLETSLLTALVESYKQATHHSSRKQILSVMADKLSFKDLGQLIPGLSRYRFHSARAAPSAAQSGSSTSPNAHGSSRESGSSKT